MARLAVAVVGVAALVWIAFVGPVPELTGPGGCVISPSKIDKGDLLLVALSLWLWSAQNRKAARTHR